MPCLTICVRDQLIKHYKNTTSKNSFSNHKRIYEEKGEKKSDKEIQNLEKHYRQKEPDQFLAMYDVIREKQNN